MAGYISEFFGYDAYDRSPVARAAAANHHCPILGAECEKRLHSVADGPAGVCSVQPITAPPVVCCPIRLYDDNYRILAQVAAIAFRAGIPLVPGRDAVPRALASDAPVIAVFGKKWGGELRVPKKAGLGGYWVDWVLALINASGDLEEFVAVEVQTIDTTGNYREGRAALLDRRAVVKTSVGLNWENVNKRILPQLIYKGQLLQREDLCRKGLFFVSPLAVYQEILKRVGGIERLPTHPLQHSAITFLAYDFTGASSPGTIRPLAPVAQHTTVVGRLQEAFNNVSLTESNVYRSAILEALGGGPLRV